MLNLASIYHRLLDLVLPPCCALCEQASGRELCADCERDYLKLGSPRCQQCAIPLPTPMQVPPQTPAHRCAVCLQDPPYFDWSYAACDYHAPWDEMVLAFKFRHQIRYAHLFARCIRDEFLHHQHRLPELLCPIPLSQQRLRKRGFNQAREIAQILSHTLGVACYDTLLCRVRDTAPQSSLSPQDRHVNLIDAITAHPDTIALIRDRHIGVVDDVMTTGATFNEAARILKHFGAKQVSNFMFARTPQ